jgi:L-amino acid N-acyltransferase YncA
MHARHARPEDAADMARIYNQGIADGTATFETGPRTASDIHAWFDGAHPLLVVEEEGAVVAFAATFPYRPRACYAGIAEASVYVDRAFRRRGAGRMALESLIAAAAAAGFWKLVSRIFVENTASRRMVAALGFREVGDLCKARPTRRSVARRDHRGEVAVRQASRSGETAS